MMNCLAFSNFTLFPKNYQHLNIYHFPILIFQLKKPKNFLFRYKTKATPNSISTKTKNFCVNPLSLQWKKKDLLFNSFFSSFRLIQYMKLNVQKFIAVHMKWMKCFARVNIPLCMLFAKLYEMEATLKN